MRNSTAITGESTSVFNGAGLNVISVSLPCPPVVEAIGKAKLSADQKVVLFLDAEGASLTGVLKAIDVEKKLITVNVRVSKTETEDKTFEVTKDTEVLTGINGVPLKLTDLKGEKDVVLQLSANQKIVRRITVSGE